MSGKLIYKLIFLTFCLIAVVATMKFSNSGDFKSGINAFFGLDIKYMKWCPSHTVDFKWLDESLNSEKAKNWAQSKSADIQQTFCEIPMEPVTDVDLAQIKFKPLLRAESAEAKTAVLEWNPESKIFQVQGLPFKSSSLSRELLDEPK